MFELSNIKPVRKEFKRILIKNNNNNNNTILSTWQNSELSFLEDRLFGRKRGPFLYARHVLHI